MFEQRASTCFFSPSRASAKKPPRSSTQNALSNARPELRSLALEPLGELRLAPDVARDLGQPELCVVHVALHLDGRDRGVGEAPVVKALRIAGVLPRLVREPAVRPPRVLDEAVPVEVTVPVDPLQREHGGLPQPPDEHGVVRPAPGLGEEDEEERRGVDGAVVAREPELGGPAVPDLVDDLPRLGVDRRVHGRSPGARRARPERRSPAPGRGAATGAT